MKVFEYVATLSPTEAERKKGERTKIIVPIASVIAKDSNEAALLGARAVPNEFAESLDRVEVTVRPFCGE